MLNYLHSKRLGPDWPKVLEDILKVVGDIM
jgi:hypothetical protein